MKACLPKDKLEKTIKEIAKLLEKRSFTIDKKLQSLINFFFFTAKVIYLGQAFLQQLHDALAKDKKYLH